MSAAGTRLDGGQKRTRGKARFKAQMATLSERRNVLNLGLLRLRPAHEYQNYSSSHLAKGPGYHERFSELPGRALMGSLEAAFLENFLRSRSISKHLDFASGTGRILALSRGLVGERFAIDVSESMLRISRSTDPDVIFVCRDFRSDVPELDGNLFDLITAFRFFANAEPDLRSEAMKFIATKLAPDGCIVLNNHRTYWSVPYLAMRSTCRRSGQYGMTNRQFVKLAASASLSVLGRVSYGIVPQTEARSLLSWGATARIERWNAKKCAHLHVFGYNTLYVLGHARVTISANAY
jgi:SAM-dependent methyltransferase